ncbi:FK506-binding protein 59 isoform X2 [Anabrus simplex]|uniref:FK506-binding protein 59 isoform X2 n=1 Tax=Anabrus simplex TaxID=316456 RepID=UPI0034DD2ED8
MENMETSADVTSSIPADSGVDISPKMDGGILKKIIREGTGTETPSPGSKVTVHYVGTLLDGTKFDSSRDRDSPFEFVIGKGSVIKAWDIGVATMKRGEIAVLTCAPEYAYGKAGSPPKIPPDSTLIFEIEAIDWLGEDLSVRKDGGVLRYVLEEGEEYSTPNDGALVQVHLTGKYSGNVFEEREVTFPLGEGSEYGVCEGLERALEKFKKGEKSRILIKSKYAFKDKGNPELNIPPNADIEYIVKMISFEKSKESWSLDSDGKLEQAKLFKDKGTHYFKNGKYVLAAKMYKKLNSYVEHSSGFEGEKEEERKALLLAGHLNLAMCYLKLDQFLEARNECDNALKLDPYNIKGLFRRGQANLGMGEPELGKKDFEAVLGIEPKNAAAANHVAICVKAMKEQKSREKTIYANMFEKFAQRDKAKEEEWKRKQPDVMKTLGEWGQDEREREMTDFERENPNILMLNRTGEFKNM